MAVTDAEIRRATMGLFVTQTFSTLGFAIIYSTLVLFATSKLNLSPNVANALMGSFAAFNYGLHLLGGYMSGRFISNRHLFIVGQVLQLIACFVIAQCTYVTLIIGLAAFLTGSGLNVTCVNNMVTQLFEPEDVRREKAFLWNYSGMNIGFFIGFAISGVFQLSHNYSMLFLLGGLGNCIAVLAILFSWKVLYDRDTYLSEKPEHARKQFLWRAYAGVLVLFIALNFLLKNPDLSNYLMMAVGVVMWIITLALALGRENKLERSRMLAFFVLTMGSFIFWSLYQLAPMGLTLFIEHNVNLNYLGMKIAPQWAQNINSVVIVVGGPIMAWLLQKLRDEYKINISNPVLFSISLVLIGLGFVVLPIGIHFANPITGLSSFNWIVLSYVLQSIAELCISPIGYAMVGRLIPRKQQGLMMGVWMMTSGIAAIASSYISNNAIGDQSLSNPLVTNPGFVSSFNHIGYASIIAGIVLVILTPWLNKMINGSKLHPVK